MEKKHFSKIFGVLGGLFFCVFCGHSAFVLADLEPKLK
jgi:hypothetical protein